MTIDVMKIGNKRKNTDTYSKRRTMATAAEYDITARRLISSVGNGIRSGLAREIFKDDDSFSYIVHALMIADLEWNGQGSKFGFRKQRVKYALWGYIERSIREKNKGEVALSDVCSDETTEIIPPSLTTPYMECIDKETNLLLRTILDGQNIGEAQSKYLQLHFLEEMSYTEIAKIHGVSKQAVGQSIQIGLTTLKTKFLNNKGLREQFYEN